MLDVAAFKSIMGKWMPKRGADDMKIASLAKLLPGLSYNPETKLVSCPLPMEDLQALANGDRSVKKRYADQLRSMSWVKDDGTERRAGQYDSTTDEFMEGVDDDYRYFTRMGQAAGVLALFDDGFLNRQKDSKDLRMRAQMAKNTLGMIENRGNMLGGTREMLFTMQYEHVKNRTWIQRLLLKNKNNKKWY